MAFGRILSAFGKLGIVALIAVAFAFGLLTTIYISLRSPNIQVPDVVNKTYLDGEKVLSKSGLDIRERAKRYKPEVPPGVILDQSPHSGDTVKEGQTIAVVVSRAPKEGEQPPDETVAEERKTERGTEGLDENRNTNSNRRKPTNRNTNGNSNSNSAANSNASGNSNANGGNANNKNANNKNANGAVNSNARRTLNTNTNARPANSNAGARTTSPPSRPSNTNRRPPTP
ncbi:MAG TPA: PASTA domain-containing protein [Pyrinomonadaceae bacterium]|nr:PASTA domain-containing protein [Pyrinomonadaceae bacterium]